MKRAVLLGLLAALMGALIVGCAPETRYKTLSFFFDGVPPPVSDKPASEKTAKAEEMDTNKKIQYREHGPYAARLCQGCHMMGTNNLLLPVQQLCFKCHELDLSKKFVHGPVAAGGCTVCHSPHGSQYPYFLVSESKDFCLHCHNKEDIMKKEVHRTAQDGCTVCHDAHSSNKRYMLK